LIIYLTPEQVLFLHSQLINKTGGEHGIRDLGLLISAVERPRSGLVDTELYPGLMLKTAALMDSLVRNHPFVDGNKRTAISAAAIFLRVNGYRLLVDNEEMVRFALACAQSQLTLSEIEDWFSIHSTSEVW
jgi:death on curing protein